MPGIDRKKLVAELEDMIHEDAARFVELRRKCMEALQDGERIPYLRTILSGCEQALDRVLGKPKQPEEHTGEMTVRVVRE